MHFLVDYCNTLVEFIFLFTWEDVKAVCWEFKWNMNQVKKKFTHQVKKKFPDQRPLLQREWISFLYSSIPHSTTFPILVASTSFLWLNYIISTTIYQNDINIYHHCYFPTTCLLTHLLLKYWFYQLYSLL